MYRSRIGRVSTVEYCIGRHDYRSPIGRLSADSRSTVDQLPVDSRPIGGGLSTDYRPIVGRQSTDIAVDIAAAISTEATYSTHDLRDVLLLVTFALKLARMDTSCTQLYVNYKS